MADPLLSVKDLEIRFDTSRGTVAAVDRVSFDVQPGEVFALVGESGCGKSTTALGIMRLVSYPGRIAGGRILFAGRDLLGLPEAEMTHVRGREISMIFQNPLTSLNPVYSAGAQTAEGLLLDNIPRQRAMSIALDVLRDVKIPDTAERAKSYPHELSGGMRQRVMIGMMIARTPKLLIADEPTTALDVTIQAQILRLLLELRDRHGTSLLVITHDFGIVAEIADRIGVMYAGNLVEQGSVYDVFDHPAHPYTRLLMRALPRVAKDEGRLETIAGTVPNLLEKPPGCVFQPRCPEAKPGCAEAAPSLREVAPGHLVACQEGGTSNV